MQLKFFALTFKFRTIFCLLPAKSQSGKGAVVHLIQDQLFLVFNFEIRDSQGDSKTHANDNRAFGSIPHDFHLFMNRIKDPERVLRRHLECCVLREKEELCEEEHDRVKSSIDVNSQSNPYHPYETNWSNLSEKERHDRVLHHRTRYNHFIDRVLHTKIMRIHLSS